MLRRLLPLVAAVLVAGCATAAPPGADPAPGASACDAAPAQFAVGRPWSAALAEEARRAARAEQVRKLEPGRAYTLEFLATRLNLEVDARDAVKAVRCG